MQLRHVFLLFLVAPALGGPQDTVDQLRMGFTTVPLSDQVFNAPVTVEQGSCPTWISGTLARHACGVYGEAGRPTEDDMLNVVPHVFDCVEMGQGYSFIDGEVRFTSRLVRSTFDFGTLYHRERGEICGIPVVVVYRIAMVV